MIFQSILSRKRLVLKCPKEYKVDDPYCDFKNISIVLNPVNFCLILFSKKIRSLKNIYVKRDFEYMEYLKNATEL